MLSKECFTPEWIEKIKNDNAPADPAIIEKTIYAFELLSKLSELGAEFVFKGGTSLLLLVEVPKRLSIDVDISTEETKEQVERQLNETVKNSVFISWEENPRSATNIPKRHYKLFFHSVINPNHNSYILLDVLFQENPYPETISKQIENKFIITNKPVNCTIPTAESLLGDKLTAFAPNTTGIPYGANKSMEIQKQLFDIGTLFSLTEDIDVIGKTFENFVKIESKYRGKSFSTEDVIDDIMNTSFLVCQILLRKADINAKTQELQEGITKLNSHLIGTRYNLEAAKLNAAKAAFVAYSIINKKTFSSNKVFDISEISNTKLKDNYKILERLKTILPEVYYYWQKISS